MAHYFGVYCCMLSPITYHHYYYNYYYYYKEIKYNCTTCHLLLFEPSSNAVDDDIRYS